MRCDYCDTDGEIKQAWPYDLDLCPGCKSKFLFKKKLESEALYELARRQEFIESHALPYDYES